MHIWLIFFLFFCFLPILITCSFDQIMLYDQVVQNHIFIRTFYSYMSALTFLSISHTRTLQMIQEPLELFLFVSYTNRSVQCERIVQTML